MAGKPRVRYELANVENAQFVAHNLRNEDWHEAYAATGVNPARAVLDSVRVSLEPFIFYIDDEPAVLVGVVPASLMSGRGHIWMMGTNKLKGNERLFLQYSREVLHYFRQRYILLENHVDARYTAAVRWLRWLGFEIEEAKPFGPFGVPFHYFKIDGEGG